MAKLIRDGKMAVLVSPGFGAGWSSWNSECPELLTDRELVEIVLSGGGEALEARAEALCPGLYMGGADSLKVEWIPLGEYFYLHEYDGNEWIVRQSDMVIASE